MKGNDPVRWINDGWTLNSIPACLSFQDGSVGILTTSFKEVKEREVTAEAQENLVEWVFEYKVLVVISSSLLNVLLIIQSKLKHLSIPKHSHPG